MTKKLKFVCSFCKTASFNRLNQRLRHGKDCIEAKAKKKR